MSTVLKTLPALLLHRLGALSPRDRAFSSSKVGSAQGAQIAIPNAGDYFLREIAGESMIVVRAGAGSVEAFYNVCRHRGTRLCTAAEGSFAGRIQCPYHGWTYGLDGRLLGAPHMDPSFFQHLDYPLHKLHTALWDGHIFLNAHPHPEPLAVQLADLPARFAALAHGGAAIAQANHVRRPANWKLIVANYNECLHCPVLHPALNRLTDYLGSDNETPQPTYIGGAMGFRGVGGNDEHGW